MESIYVLHGLSDVLGSLSPSLIPFMKGILKTFD